MHVVDRFFEEFNRGVPRLEELATETYSYGEPRHPGPFDRVEHKELMAQVLERYPDRRMDVLRRIPGGDGALVHATWSGTPATGGDVFVIDAFFAFDIDPVSERVSRLRGYY